MAVPFFTIDCNPKGQGGMLKIYISQKSLFFQCLHFPKCCATIYDAQHCLTGATEWIQVAGLQQECVSDQSLLATRVHIMQASFVQNNKRKNG